MGEIVFVLNKEEGIRILEFKLKFEKKNKKQAAPLIFLANQR